MSSTRPRPRLRDGCAGVRADARLATTRCARTGVATYAAWYDKLWAYSWQHFVDHDYGAWYRILTVDNRKVDDEKSPAGKVDYHTMGACHELLLLRRKPA